MNSKEKKFFIIILVSILIIVILDLISDSREGAQSWHLLAEGFMGFMALVGIYLSLKKK